MFKIKLDKLICKQTNILIDCTKQLNSLIYLALHGQLKTN